MRISWKYEGQHDQAQGAAGYCPEIPTRSPGFTSYPPVARPSPVTSRLRLHLRQQLLEIYPAAEGVEVRLLQFAGKGPAELDDVREGGDGLVGERLGLGRRHAGLRVCA
jgi:hypothetical protein